MLDPFPIPPPAFLSNAIEPLASKLSLPTLPFHGHEVLLAFSLYLFIQTYVSPYLSSRLFPTIYSSLNKRTKLNWDVHVVSLIQSLVVSFLALWVSFKDEERRSMDWRERVFGYTGGIGIVQAFACGYFLWDFYMCSVYMNVFGPGMLAHAISALSVFTLGFVSFSPLLGTSNPGVWLYCGIHG